MVQAALERALYDMSDGTFNAATRLQPALCLARMPLTQEEPVDPRGVQWSTRAERTHTKSMRRYEKNCTHFKGEEEPTCVGCISKSDK